MASPAVEVTWLASLLNDLVVDKVTYFIVHCDNQSKLHIAKNLVFHESTKHIYRRLTIIKHVTKSWKVWSNFPIFLLNHKLLMSSPRFCLLLNIKNSCPSLVLFLSPQGYRGCWTQSLKFTCQFSSSAHKC